jgi:catalase
MQTIKGALQAGVEAILSTDGEGRAEGLATRATGCPLHEAQLAHSLSVGPRGPLLLQDVALLERLQHFDREKIAPRNVHALGCGAHGKFTVTHDVSAYTCASVFAQVGKTTPLFARFSAIFLEQGEADTTRDPRGFAVKFYTDEGNWDLLAINTPVFAVRDIAHGPDCVHAFKRDPRSGEWHDTQFWDYVVMHPEAWHQTLMIYTNRGGTPLSFRAMHAYGCNTYSLCNGKGERFWCKWHLLAERDVKALSDADAKLLAGEDPDWLKRDLREAIGRGEYPTWRLAVQLMTEEEGYRFPGAFDCTKVWPHGRYPLIDIGRIELHRNPSDYFAEVEQVAFSPANIVPGLGFSPDKLLQGRLFNYPDTQFHRLGPNYLQLPINAPQPAAKVATNYIGGQAQHDRGRKWPHYSPSLYGAIKGKEGVDPPLHCEGLMAQQYALEGEGSDDDLYGQPRSFVRNTLDDEERVHLAHNIATSLACVRDEKVVSAALKQLCTIDEELGSRVDTQRRDLMSGRAKRTVGCELWHNLHARLEKEQIV